MYKYDNNCKDVVVEILFVNCKKRCINFKFLIPRIRFGHDLI